MDQQALEYTRSHYNRHSNQYTSTKHALHARKSGPGAPLKYFHNSIKRALINRFAHGVDSLLDLACGRGGDIHKWMDADIARVTGVDLSPGEIEEARKRFAETKARAPHRRLDCCWEVSSDLGLADWHPQDSLSASSPRLFDAATCMFAIHYFFASEDSLKQFFRNVAANLKPGGYFFGTVPDGRRVNEALRQRRDVRLPMLSLSARWEGAPACFGSPYVCAIGDTVTGDERGTQGSFEYLVYTNVLVGVAAAAGLHPVRRYASAELEAMFEPRDADLPLKHFEPSFPASDPSLELASRLFAAFVFQKVDRPELARAPHAASDVASGAAGADRGSRAQKRDPGAEVPHPPPAGAAFDPYRGGGAGPA
ncbi:hypothetical protein H632_c707p0, partial [Helicosporidium sp. ATCC 50920]